MEQVRTFATNPNWHPLPWMDFITAWKLSHRVLLFKGLSLFLDVWKPEIAEEPLLKPTSFEVRIRFFLHWLWFGGQPPAAAQIASPVQDKREPKPKSLWETIWPALLALLAARDQGCNQSRPIQNWCFWGELVFLGCRRRG